MSFTLNIDEVQLLSGNESVPDGSYQLYAFQEEVKYSTSKLTVVRAPTGSGKTLALLMNFLEYSDKSGRENGAFIYPTNQLIIDQARAIKDLLAKLGQKSEIIGLDEENPEDLRNATDSDLLIIVVTGESLETLCEKIKGKCHGKVLEWVLNNREKTYLMLTNIDTIQVLFQAKYSRRKSSGPRGKSTADHLFNTFLKTFSYIALDEFHLYTGIMYANTIYLLWLMKDRFSRILVCSATLHDGVELLLEMFEQSYKIIEAEPSEGKKVRYETEIEFKPISEPPPIIWKTEDIENIVRLVNDLRKNKEKMIIILNSVMAAEVLYTKLATLHTDVGAITGFVPRAARTDSDLLVGTSAIEVGIDFDVSLMFGEANTANSLIQRLGRLGRKRPGRGVFFIPSSTYQRFRDSLQVKEEESNYVSYKSFSECAFKSFNELRSYADFAKSSLGKYIFCGLLWPWAERERKRIHAIKNIYKNTKPYFFDEEPVTETKLLEIISKGGARGDILSVPAYFPQHNAWSTVSIFDLKKLDFESRSSQEVEKPNWVRNEYYIYVSGIKENPLKWTGIWTGINYSKIPLIARTLPGKEDINLGLDPHFFSGPWGDEIRKMLHETFAIPSYELRDWRFSWISIDEDAQGNKYLILGLDSFLEIYSRTIGAVQNKKNISRR